MDPLRIAFLGDVMLGRGVGAEIARRAPESFWTDLREVLVETDLVVANLECAITSHPVPWTRTPKVFHFRAPPKAVEVLHAAGIRLVSLANNHVLDFEVEGFLDTLRHLDEAGIARAGAGRDVTEAARPGWVEAAGHRIAMIAATDNEPGWAAGPRRPGVLWRRFDLDEARSREAVERGVEESRAMKADVIVLSLHWGPNMAPRPPARFRAFAQWAVEQGVDILHGHSAHIFQGIGVHRGRPILFDTGDALDDYAVDPVLRNDQSLVFVVEIDESGPRALTMIPIRLRYAEVGLAKGSDLEAIRARMVERSAELGTRVESSNDRLRVELRS
jgi:poly-gamma-glutamate capsule biosynthesis protein CapA/YwtB (metallophosphatase superfamily)